MYNPYSIFHKGSIIQGRYVIDELLGKGGFGAVYKVRDRGSNDSVFALKELIHPTKFERESFLAEGTILRRLDHYALPKVYRIFEDKSNNRSYMLMDFIDGPDLGQLRLQQPQKRFTLPEILHLLSPIIEVLNYLHHQNPPIIHRDIKPANIIIPTNGSNAVLVDFGLAKEYEADSTTAAIRHCSPYYSAPEHYTNGTGIYTDVYSLGAIVYTLLTSEPPTDALNRMACLSRRGIDPLKPANTLEPALSEAVTSVMERVLTIDSQKRFSSIDNFWQALKEAPHISSMVKRPLVLSSEDFNDEPEVENSSLLSTNHQHQSAFSLIDAISEDQIDGTSKARSTNRTKSGILLTVLTGLTLAMGGFFAVNLWSGREHLLQPVFLAGDTSTLPQSISRPTHPTLSLDPTALATPSPTNSMPVESDNISPTREATTPILNTPDPSPTPQPTSSPTQHPKPTPSPDPTPHPATPPTQPPVPPTEPVKQPTQTPSPLPEPTIIPTPTQEPTSIPTPSPMPRPTPIPTDPPTPHPNPSPTRVLPPTIEPDPTPTAEPTPTDQPTPLHQARYIPIHHPIKA